MSCFINPEFVKEFAYRTMINYINAKNMSISDPPTPEIQSILNMMKKRGYTDFSQKYEITLAINSLIGLLIFPQQEYYDEIKETQIFDQLPNLKKCIDSDEKYRFKYYHMDKGCLCSEDETPSNILRHMRNAVSHGRMGIEPETKSGNDITHIRFKDACFYIKHDNRYSQNNLKECKQIKDIQNRLNRIKDKTNIVICDFDLRIAVEDLERVIFEIAQFLINQGG